MLDRHTLARHAPASALLIATLFLAISVLGYDPADPPGSAAEPANHPALNPGGPVGATLAHVLFTTVGWSSILVLHGLAAVDFMLFRRRSLAGLALRVAGLSLMVAVGSAVFQWFGTALRPTHPVGPGGYLGALLTTILYGQFGFAGMILILGAAGVVGLSLAHDAFFVWTLFALGISATFSVCWPRADGGTSRRQAEDRHRETYSRD